MSADLPYRPNVGIALFNAAGRVFIARRFKDDGPEMVLPGLDGQMPQAASMLTKIRARRPCASSTRKPASPECKVPRRDAGLDDLRLPAV